MARGSYIAAAVVNHYGVSFKQLIDDGLHILCLLGQDATLCAVGKSGRVEVTGLYRQLYEMAGDLKPTSGEHRGQCVRIV